MLGEGGLAGVMTRFRKSGAARVQEQIAPLFPAGASAIPVEIMSHFLIGGLNALLAWWLENDRPYSAEYMAQAFHQLVVMGLQGVLSGENEMPDG